MLIVPSCEQLDNTAFEPFFCALSGCRTRVTIAPILSVDPSTNRIGLPRLLAFGRSKRVTVLAYLRAFLIGECRMEITTQSPIKDVFEQEYLPSNLRITSKSTIRHYDITIRQLSEYLGRPCTLADLSDGNCTRFCRWLQEHKKVSSQTIAQRMNYLRAFWRWCARERYVEKWPNFQTAPSEKPLPRAWTIQNIAKLMEAAAQTKGYVTCIPAGIWWFNLHRFAWETGERKTAMLSARWNDVDTERCLVEIPAKYRKGKCKGMLYTISQELMEDLVAMRPGDEPRLFPWASSEATFYNQYAKILKRAGLPSDHKSKIHRMRKSFASHLEANGGDATQALGHSRRTVTSESYLDESIIKRTPAFKMLPKIEGGAA